MKNWIRKKIWNFLNDTPKLNAVSIDGSPRQRIDSDGLGISVYSAVGGNVIEIRKYDRAMDRGSNKLYIVSTDKNFGEEVSKIITLEMMR
jgi:hypothetical protein